jgi:hypothetical protein
MPRIGKPKFKAMFVTIFPNFTKEGKEMSLNNQYARLRSLLDLFLKAISVLSKDIILKINLFF